MLSRSPSMLEAVTAQKGDSLAQHSFTLGLPRRLALGFALLGLPALTVLTAFGIAPGTATEGTISVLVRESVALHDPAPSVTQPQHYVSQERVLRGDTVAALLDRLGVSDARALGFLKSDPIGRIIFRQLVPGRTLQAETGEEGELIALRYFLGSASLLEVSRTPEGFSARNRSVTGAPRIVYKSTAIRSSLFAATDAAGIPDAIAMQLARVFATDIDFHTDLRKGDRFCVVYEMVYDSGELVAPGRILAAQFVNDGRVYHAVLLDRKSTRLNSSHIQKSRMPSSA